MLARANMHTDTVTCALQRNYPSLFCTGNLKHRRPGQNLICHFAILSFSEDIFVVARPTFLVRLFWQLRNIRNGMLVSEMYNTLWVYLRFTV